MKRENNYEHKNILKVVMTKYILVNVAHKRNSRHYREHCRDEGYACDQEHGVPLIKADVAATAANSLIHQRLVPYAGPTGHPACSFIPQGD